VPNSVSFFKYLQIYRYLKEQGTSRVKGPSSYPFAPSSRSVSMATSTVTTPPKGTHVVKPLCTYYHSGRPRRESLIASFEIYKSHHHRDVVSISNFLFPFLFDFSFNYYYFVLSFQARFYDHHHCWLVLIQ
jgi:hypothetical protein